MSNDLSDHLNTGTPINYINPMEAKEKLDEAYAHFANLLNYVCILHPEMIDPGFADDVDKMLAETWDYYDVRRQRG